VSRSASCHGPDGPADDGADRSSHRCADGRAGYSPTGRSESRTYGMRPGLPRHRIAIRIRIGVNAFSVFVCVSVIHYHLLKKVERSKNRTDSEIAVDRGAAAVDLP